MIPGGGWLKNAADSAVRGLHEDLVWMLELTTLLFGVFDGNSEVGKGNVTFSIYSHWQLQQKWIELHKYDIYLNIYTAVVRAGDRPSLYLFYYFPSTIVLTESSSLERWPPILSSAGRSQEKWPVFSVRFYCDRSVLTLQMVPYLQYLLSIYCIYPGWGQILSYLLSPAQGVTKLGWAGLGWLAGLGWAGWLGGNNLD